MALISFFQLNSRLSVEQILVLQLNGSLDGIIGLKGIQSTLLVAANSFQATLLSR